MQSLIPSPYIYYAIADYLGPTDSFHLKATCKTLFFHSGSDPELLHFNPSSSNITQIEFDSVLKHEKYCIGAKLIREENWEDILFPSPSDDHTYNANDKMVEFKLDFIRYCALHGLLEH